MSKLEDRYDKFKADFICGKIKQEGFDCLTEAFDKARRRYALFSSFSTPSTSPRHTPPPYPGPTLSIAATVAPK